MKVLVAGANGLIGAALIDHLDGKHRMDVLTTTPDKARQRFGAESRYWTWDDLEQNEGTLLKEYDLIINLAGAPIMQRWTGSARREIWESRVGKTRLIANQVLGSGRTDIRVINASSTYVYGYLPNVSHQNEHVFDERSDVNAHAGGNFIVDVCRAWEGALGSLEDTRVVKLRIGVVLSRRGGVLPPIIRYARIGLGGSVGSGLQPFPWISITDALRAIDFVIDRPELHGAINIVSPQSITQREAGHTVGKLLNKHLRVGMPSTLIRALYGEMGMQTTLNGPQVHPAVLLAAGFRFEDVTLGQSLRRLLQYEV